MTMREIFRKVETYNEIAETMRTQKAAILFYDRDLGFFRLGEEFKTYQEFAKYVRRELVKEIADKVLKDDCWEIDGGIEFDWAGGIAHYEIELVAQ